MSLKRSSLRSRRAASSTAGGAVHALQQSLQKLDEATFTQEVLVPLFKAIGYERVDYYGGSDEKGKDLILWRHDAFGDPELAVAQVKLYKPSRASSSNKALVQIINQLAQAIHNRVPDAEGTKRLPRDVFFITPFSLDTRTLESHLDRYAELRFKGLRILDGPRLSELLVQKARHVVRSLLGEEFDISEALECTLNNETLLRALAAERSREIESFYTDIDFLIGNPAVHLFLLFPMRSWRQVTTLDDREWRQFCEVNATAQRAFRARLSTRAISEIEKSYSRPFAAWRVRENTRRRLVRQIHSLQRLIIEKQQEWGQLSRSSIIGTASAAADGIGWSLNKITAIVCRARVGEPPTDVGEPGDEGDSPQLAEFAKLVKDSRTDLESVRPLLDEVSVDSRAVMHSTREIEDAAGVAVGSGAKILSRFCEFALQAAQAQLRFFDSMDDPRPGAIVKCRG